MEGACNRPRVGAVPHHAALPVPVGSPEERGLCARTLSLRPLDDAHRTGASMVWIYGQSREELLGLHLPSIEGVMLSGCFGVYAERIDALTLRVSAYVTDRALAEIVARGGCVATLMSKAQLETHMVTVQAQIVDVP